MEFREGYECVFVLSVKIPTRCLPNNCSRDINGPITPVLGLFFHALDAPLQSHLRFSYARPCLEFSVLLYLIFSFCSLPFYLW